MNDEGNNVGRPEGEAHQQAPGIVVSPGATETPAPAEPASSPETAQPAYTTEAPVQSTGPEEAAYAVQPAGSAAESDGAFTWTAPQFIVHLKTSGWYLKVVGVALVLAALLYLVTRDKISTAMVIVAGLILCVYTLRKPRDIVYRVHEFGVDIDSRQFDYGEFRCFTAAPEGNYLNITLLPLKRFSPVAGLVYMGQDGQKIIQLLSDRLPFEQYKPDPLDRALHKIGF